MGTKQKYGSKGQKAAREEFKGKIANRNQHQISESYSSSDEDSSENKEEIKEPKEKAKNKSTNFKSPVDCILSSQESIISLHINKSSSTSKKNERSAKKVNPNKSPESSDSETIFDEAKMNKRELKEYEKATHVIREIKTTDKNLVNTTGEIKNANVIHISQNRNITLAYIKQSTRLKSSKSSDSPSKVKHIKYEMELKELSTPFDCFQSATVFVIAKCTNPGIYAIHAGPRHDKFYHYPITENNSCKYNKEKWTEVEIEKENKNHCSNVQECSACYDGEDSIYLTGGCDSTAFKHCFLFDTKTKQRSKIASLNESRCGHSSYIFKKEKNKILSAIELDPVEKDLNKENADDNKNILYVFGGMNSSLQIVSQSIERLDLNNKESAWELIKLDLSQGECILTCSQVLTPFGSQSDDKFILLGGSNNLKGVAQEICHEIEIMSTDSGVTAIAKPGTYFMKLADSFYRSI